MQLTGIILIFMAILGKVGAVFCMIPEPIIGALAVVSLGAVFGELEHNHYQIVEELSGYSISLQKRPFPTNTGQPFWNLLLGCFPTKILVTSFSPSTLNALLVTPHLGIF